MIRPLGPRVLVKPDSAEEQTKSGIIIPEIARNPTFLTGTIVKVGTRIDIDVKEGDHVSFAKVYDEVTFDKETYYLIEQPFLTAILE